MTLCSNIFKHDSINIPKAPRKRNWGALFLQSASENLQLAPQKALENLSFAPGALPLQSVLENLSLACSKQGSLAPSERLRELEPCSGSLATSKRLGELELCSSESLGELELCSGSLAPSKRLGELEPCSFKAPSMSAGTDIPIACRCRWPCLPRHCPALSLSLPSSRCHTRPYCALASLSSMRWHHCPSCAGFCSITKPLGTHRCCRAGPFLGMS